MYRTRIYLDAITEAPLTTRQANTVAKNTSTLGRTAAFLEVEGVHVRLEAPPQCGAHEHHSEPGYNCPYCTAMAGDQLNNSNTGVE